MKAADLLRLADALDNLPLDDHHTFSIWTWHEDNEVWTDDGEAEVCGFAACAIGWGIHLGVTPIGLKLGLGMPFYGTETDVYAVARAYDISYLEASRLFLGGHYKAGSPTPAMVSARIREFVSEAS